MDFIRNVLVVDKSLDVTNDLKNKITTKSNKFVVYTLSSRLQLAEIAGQQVFKYLFINANIGKKDVQFILRYFSTIGEDKTCPDLTIFLVSEDYDLLQEVLTDFTFKNIQFLHTPFDPAELVDKVYNAAFRNNNSIIGIKNKNANYSVDLEFMNVFINSTKKTLADMAQLPELSHSPPKLMSQVKESLEIVISAKILISSPYFKGSYYIAFPKDTFFNFYERVVMEKCTTITEENKDFIGELANIIYGQSKKKFAEYGFNLDMVIPTIHLGEISYPVVVLIPFDSELGKFYLAIAPGLI